MVGNAKRAPFEEDAVAWTVQKLLVPLALSHLRSIHSLEESPESAADAERHADELLLLLTTPLPQRVSSISLSGIELEGERLEAGQYVIRRLTPAEASDIAAMMRKADPPSRLGASPLAHLPYREAPAYPTVVVEMHEAFDPISDQRLWNWEFERILVSLQLYGFHIAGTGSVVHGIQPEWAFRYHTYSNFLIPTRTDHLKVCGSALWLNVSEAAAKIPNVRPAPAGDALDVAVHRFSLGCSRAIDLDALLDFVIALEAVLLPEPIKSEAVHRFRLNGANLLTDDPSERLVLWKDLQDIYAMRSKIAHGGKFPDWEAISSSAERSRQLAARAILKALEFGKRPNEEYFKKRALGIEPT